MQEIKFYKVSEAYGNFSNFAPFPIVIEGKTWPTVEHYFQAQKFEDVAVQERICNIPSPMKAAIEGRNRDNNLRADWNEVKDAVIFRALISKFWQNPALLEELPGTQDAILIEHTQNDSYWADGGDGSGKNMLGKLLMDTRKVLRDFTEDPELVLPPWEAFPKVDKHDLFWRMGVGEGHMDEWFRYYSGLETPLNYQYIFPEPESWNGFYG